MDNTLFIDLIPEIPFTQWFADIISWLTDNLSAFFNLISDGAEWLMDAMTAILLIIPPEIFIILIGVLAYFAAKKTFSLPTFSVVALFYIYNQGLWEELMFTTTLVILSSLISIVIGIPVGIWMSKSQTVNNVVQPILDFMQTMPAFVYLIPAVAFFGIGMVPGVFSSVIYAAPPVIRFTNLGIREVDDEMIEAAESFGSTSRQRLFKVELPLAKSTIMAGINQTVMLALSMVVIASMIGAPGLGDQVVRALQQARSGPGFVAGFALVGLAIVMDRILQGFGQDQD
ncbi:Glycine betaine/L-proline transport system permease protein proW [Alloiococcus otitis]|uniref:ABC transmembrane type-1 domain-containing protein n=1 Tax=Alloiococcus otitis ATCC 51267 TaxID=883081 RepID=K9EBA7_9LACT|nr:hypothetical protein HMPREF9698_00524 [Alloiococcus otitis ATCC 51267]SUU81648.1 Glycine betaine/L-proline transport system permease protein proW [Alloiococcus otitis]